MFKSLNSKFLLIVALTLGVLTACSDSDEKSETAAAIASAGSLLSYVPADSPYVFASLAPLPEDVMDKLEPKIDRILHVPVVSPVEKTQYEHILAAIFFFGAQRFIRKAFYERFDLAPEREFAELHSGGGAVGVKLNRLDSLPDLIQKLRSHQ